MADSPRDPGSLPPVDEWIGKLEFRSTAEVKIPERLVDQVIGQEHAVEVIRKAAEQKRHVMLIGDPGTGKSMLARSMTELLPRDEGRDIVNAQKAEAMQRREQKSSMMMTIIFFIIGLSVIMSYNWQGDPTQPPFNATVILFGILVAAIIYIATRYTGHRQENLMVPKLLVTHSGDEMPPFIDAAGTLDAGQGMHPALRSRIRGYGYEIYMKSTMPDTDDNRMKLVRFVAPEVSKDKKIPHFDRTAGPE